MRTRNWKPLLSFEAFSSSSAEIYWDEDSEASSLRKQDQLRNCNESSVCFVVFGFWHTTNTGPSPKLSSDILLLPPVIEILTL
ncbi:hypothetical protein STEG23_027417 [Scotinomys teguina]